MPLEIPEDEKRRILIEEQAEVAAELAAKSSPGAGAGEVEAAPAVPAPTSPPQESGVRHRPQAVVPPGGPPTPKPSPRALAPFEAAPVAVVETAQSAAAAQAKAAVEARYVVAWRNPRDLDDVRTRLLRECRRPSFAKVARYRKPIGAGIEGPSIRFAEAAMRCMGNMLAETSVIYDDDDKRIVRVMVTDLETNMSYPQDKVITKLVERRTLRRGQQAISQRTNSDGVITYTVRASEDDLLNKEGAQISKAMRTCALRLIPGDIVDEAMDLCRETQANEAAKDPDAERKDLADGFAELNVTPADLAKYLGHDLGKCSPAELVNLRALYSAVRDGEATWAEILESAGTGDAPSGKGTDGLKSALKK